MSESKEHLLTDADSSYHDDTCSTIDDHLPLHRNYSAASFTNSPSFWKYLRIAAYTWAVLCTVPALLFFISTLSYNTQHEPSTSVANVAQPIHDYDDGFSTFRKTDTCSFSTLDLHKPFEPLCDTRVSLLKAMSSGGRVGFDAPYSPRGCDMRWFRPDEMCEILSRFSKVQIIGDSLMRNLAVAINLLMRTDLYNGGRTTWVEDPEGADCHCSGPFQDRDCDVWHITANTELVHANDPGSLYCPFRDTAIVNYFVATSYPLVTEKKDEMEKVLQAVPDEPYGPDDKPVAFVFGHGLWNDLEADKTYEWWETIDSSIQEKAPWLYENGTAFPRLFITPTASGVHKPEVFWSSQGNLRMKVFEETVGPYMEAHGIDHLGMFNASIQYNSFDGTHGGMKLSLLKAMMVLNWLNSH